jgi:PHP family Zn ribbon phosphoesterase
MSLESLWRWAQMKGITVIGTGDFTHPKWLQELKEKLDVYDNKLFKLNDKYKRNDVPLSCASDVLFIPSAEISCIYSKKGKRKKH